MINPRNVHSLIRETLDCAALTRNSKKMGICSKQKFLINLLHYEEVDIEEGLRNYINGRYFLPPASQGERFAIKCIKNSYKNRMKTNKVENGS